MIKNKLLLLLALLMTAATGAWAQGLQVTQITKEMIASWEGVTGNVSLADLQALGFAEVSDDDAKAWTGAPASDDAYLFYGYTTDGKVKMAIFYDGNFVMSNSVVVGKYDAYNGIKNGLPHFITIASAAPKHLIEVSDGKDAKTMEQALPYTTTVGELYQAAYGQDLSDMFQLVSLQDIESTNTSAVSVGALDGASTPVTVNADGKATVVIKFDGGYTKGIFVNAVSPLYVTLNDGTENPTTWTASTDGTNFGALPIGGLKGDGSETVTLKYNGRLKVKGVKATSDAVPAEATVTTAPQATTGDIKAGSTTALVSGGVADGGTLMYAVTTENTKPTTTEGFSADVPTAEGRTAGTYYVWYYVKADDSHIDSEISATAVSVTVKAAVTTVTWDNPIKSFIGYIHDGESRSKDGVTVKALNGQVDDEDNRFMGFYGGNSFQFSTALGNFTKIEVTCSFGSVDNGNGWSSNVWTGSDSTVNFGTYFTPTKIVFTIEPTN